MEIYSAKQAKIPVRPVFSAGGRLPEAVDPALFQAKGLDREADFFAALFLGGFSFCSGCPSLSAGAVKEAHFFSVGPAYPGSPGQ